METVENCNKMSALYFGIPEVDSVLEKRKDDLEKLIIAVLEATYQYSDFDAITGERNCSAHRSRSVIDIYRHIKYHLPEIKIQEVMHTMYTIYKKNGGAVLVGHYCSNVQRRVFKLHWQEPSWELKGASFPDEFGIPFSAWEYI